MTGDVSRLPGDGAADLIATPAAERALLLSVRADWLGVPLGTVRVVLEAPAITRVPEGPPTLAGVVNVRGEVVPVLDTAVVLGVGAPVRAEVVAVIESALGPFALAASDVLSAALTDDLGPSDLALATGRRRAGDLVATILDADAVARSVRGTGA